MPVLSWFLCVWHGGYVVDVYAVSCLFCHGLFFFNMRTGVRLWMRKCMPCKWECLMPAWHVHVDRDRDRDMCWLRAALSHRGLYLDGNALTTLPPDVFDSLGSLTYVIPVPWECVVAANIGHERQFLVWSTRVWLMCLTWRVCRWCVCVHTASLCLFNCQVTRFLHSLLECNCTCLYSFCLRMQPYENVALMYYWMPRWSVCVDILLVGSFCTYCILAVDKINTSFILWCIYICMLIYLCIYIFIYKRIYTS